MQDTAGVWLMTSLTTSPFLIALMQTAASLPVLLLGLPAGALADIVDRRRLLIFWSAWMLLAAALLSIFALAGSIGPVTLLLLTFILSLGSAMNGPTWQAIVPELVPREQVPTAVALNSAGFNLSRAVGPASGALLVAAFASVMMGAGVVFLINSAGFMAVLYVLYRWKRTAYFKSALPAERLIGSMRAALRYVWYTPAMWAVLVRSFMLTFFVSALWALLAVVARDDLKSEALGYGILNGTLGIGAVIGAFTLPRLRHHLSADSIVRASAIVFMVTMLVMAWVPYWLPLILMLLVGGMAWTDMASSLNISLQLSVPAWVQARMLGLYQMVFMGGMALGSAFWGAIADRLNSSLALTLASAGLLVTWPLMSRFRLLSGGEHDVSPGKLAGLLSHVPEAVVEPDPEEGPVMVTVTFRIDPSRADEFVTAAQELGRVRQRDGAMRWALFRDPADPACYVESYLVESWLERQRQLERFTVADHKVRDKVFSFHLDPEPPRVARMVYTQPPTKS